MFRRNRPQSTHVATGSTHCRLCGIDVELDNLGRCRLGHRVAAPGEPRDDASTGPDAWLTGADDVIGEAGAEPTGKDVADSALSPSAAAVEDVEEDVIDDAHEIPALRSPSVFASVPEKSFESTSAAFVGSRDVAAASSDKAEEDEDEPSKRPTSAGSAGADASRERLLEAASWFSMSEDS